MAKQIKRYSIILLFGVIISFQGQSQEIENGKPLPEILSHLEKRFDIQFNYAEDVISSLVVAPPSESLTLLEALNHLELETGLLFKLTDDNTVLVIWRQFL